MKPFLLFSKALVTWPLKTQFLPISLTSQSYLLPYVMWGDSESVLKNTLYHIFRCLPLTLRNPKMASDLVRHTNLIRASNLSSNFLNISMVRSWLHVAAHFQTKINFNLATAVAVPQPPEELPLRGSRLCNVWQCVREIQIEHSLYNSDRYDVHSSISNLQYRCVYDFAVIFG